MKCYRLILSILLPILPGLCQAENSYVVSDTEILKSAFEMSGACTVAVYTNDDKDVLVLLNDMGEGRLNCFFKANGHWDILAETLLFTPASIIEKQQQWRLCVIDREDTPDKKIRTVVSIYNTDNATLDLEKPEVVITIPADKVFANENTKKGEQLLSLPDKTENYLLVGKCRETKWDPISIAGSIISGGHGAFAEWPFLAEIKADKVVSYHKWPEGLWTNDVIDRTKVFLLGNTCHLVAKKSKAYMPSLQEIKYVSFDINKKQWGKPSIVYREIRKGGIFSYRDPIIGYPAILSTEDTVFVAWSLSDDDRLGAGIFIRSMDNNKWSNIEKISSSGGQPLIIEHNKVIYIFWGEKGKGLFYSSYENGIWSKPQLVVKDENIFTYHSSPWAIATDDDGSFHIVYPQRCSSKGYRIKNLIYVKLEKD